MRAFIREWEPEEMGFYAKFAEEWKDIIGQKVWGKCRKLEKLSKANIYSESSVSLCLQR